jgi:hypothetical protein
MSAAVGVWPLVKELAAELDGNREHSEHTLDQLEAELRGVPREMRDEIRRSMVQIVASLSRLEMRLVAADGPVQAAV